jgi:hypothetical protein
MAEVKAELPRVLHRWMLGALLVAILAGGAGFGIWWQYHQEHERPPPAANPCFTALANRLRRPVIVAPSEPYTLDDGETLYLSDAQIRSAGCAARLPGRYDFKLARIWVMEDPDAQANAIRELVLGVPPGTEHDKTAFGLWRLGQGTLGALPESEARERAKRDIDQTIGCRFKHDKLPSCSTRPGFPIHAGVLGGIGALGLLALLGGLGFFGGKNIRARFARRKARRAAAATPASSPVTE